MLWRVVNFLDRLLFCQHAEMVHVREADGSLWRHCTSCSFKVQLMAKANVVPLFKAKPSSNVVPLTRKAK